MKVYDIIAEKYYPVKEETQTLNEFLPAIAGGITIGAVLTAVSAGMAAWGAYDIYKFISKYNEDPEQITEDQWDDLFIDAALIFTPGLAKVGRPFIVKWLPRPMLRKLSKMLRKKVLDLFPKKLKGLDPKSDLAKKYREMLKKNRLKYTGKELAERNAKAKAWARGKMRGVDKVASALVTVGSFAYYVNDYYESIFVLEDEWKNYVAHMKDGTPLKLPNRFDGMAYEDAKSTFDTERNVLLGKATIGVITGAGFVGKFVQWIGGAAKTGGIVLAATGAPMSGVGVSVAGKLLQGIGGLLGKVLGSGTAVNAAGRAALIAFLEKSDLGKTIQQSALAYMIFGATGWFTDKILDALRAGYEKLQELAAQIGITLPNLPGIITPGGGSDKPDPELDRREAERKSKRIRVNGIDVTDYQGNLTSNRVTLLAPSVQNAIDIAKAEGKPHPLAGIPRKPGVQYPEDAIRMY